jgi:micrococcal nuclease
VRFSADLTAYILLTLLVLWTLAQRLAPYHGDPAACGVGYVYDGDTFEMHCGSSTRSARLLGFDAPETKSPKCPEEAAWGHRATLRLRQLLTSPDVAIYLQGVEKYGRDLVRVTVNGRDVAEVMIGEGLAVAYHGEKRRDWCGAG